MARKEDNVNDHSVIFDQRAGKPAPVRQRLVVATDKSLTFWSSAWKTIHSV